MTALTVWKFDDPEGADRAAKTLSRAASDGVVTIVDHAIFAWPTDAEKPEIHHKHTSAKRGAGWGAFWGILGGALFMIPVAGAALGAGLGLLMNATDGTGITEEDLERIRAEVVPGTSALFMVTEGADLDRLGERFHAGKGVLIHTNLTAAERAMLLETFGGA